MIFPRDFKTMPNGCIELEGQKPKARYRSVRFEGNLWRIHRLSYSLNVSTIPQRPKISKGLVLHHCDNKHCTNSDHLYLGDQSDNMKDRNERCEGWMDKIANYQTGRKHSAETRAKMSKARTGRKHSAETRLKMASTHREKNKEKAIMEHSDLVKALAKPGAEIAANMTAEEAHLIHMVLGICGEAGELLDAVKKSCVYKKPLDIANVVEELGDIEFYLEGLRQGLSLQRETTLIANKEKLNKRYAAGSYSDKAAQDRADKPEGH